MGIHYWYTHYDANYIINTRNLKVMKATLSTKDELKNRKYK